MAITDAAGMYLDVNDAFCTFLACGPDQLLGMSFRLPLGEIDPGGDALQSLVDGREEMFSLETRYFTARGAELWARTTGVAARDERGDLVRVILQVHEPLTRRAVQAARERHESVDELTGLANRREFYSRLEAALTLPTRTVRRLGLLIVNLDRFRQLNSGLGNETGNTVLQEVGRRLKAAVRGEDVVARLSGDEFAIIAGGMGSSLDAVAMAIQVRESLKRPYWVGGNAVYASARVGVVTDVAGVNAETMMQMASAATVDAKALTGGWALDSDGANTSSRDEFGFVRDLRSAIADSALTVAYQPIVDHDGGVHHFEALARWHHPERGPVPPDQFIVLAEHNGLIADLTDVVLRSAVEQTAEWRAQGLEAAVAVNLSGALLSAPGLAEQLRTELAAAALPPDALTLEITETSLAEGSSPQLWHALNTIRETGIRISIDDFGTGYSSLTYLKQLPVDELKIDRSFILDLDTDNRTERIIRSIIDLAHSLGLAVVAEGVEDVTVGDRLVSLGVDYLQGYAIARPATSETTTVWLRDRTIAASHRTRTTVRSDLTILVIDARPEFRVGLTEQLTATGHRVVHAPSCRAALDEVSRSMPDVVILDRDLPSINGIDATPLLREAHYLGPILVFSGHLPEEVALSRFPLDVWPVSIEDEALLVALVDGYAANTNATARRRHPGSRAAR
jgi:diguanylate cyclase (GGDEF)-like protein